MSEQFTAYRVSAESAGFVVDTLDHLDTGNVLIRVHYSSVNYKDALAATGKGKVIRRFPCIAGVDAAGEVLTSQDERFKSGDLVLVTGYGMGVEHDGGYTTHLRVPADWVVPLPKSLDCYQAMALGTAGFTAALAIHRLEQNDLHPKNGKVLVTGATGGVSSLLIQMLSQRGYQVVASSRKSNVQDDLIKLGATEVIPANSLLIPQPRPLEKSCWAAVFDSVGGPTLSSLIPCMQQSGVIACYGNTSGVELNTTVLPFILRGIRLIGIDSAATQMSLRTQIWQRLANDLFPKQLNSITKIIRLHELPEIFLPMLAGETKGRVVVDCLT